MAYIYLLPLKDKTAFKIGKSDIPMRRLTELSHFYDVDTSGIVVVKCYSTPAAFRLESMLHGLLDDKHVVFDLDGGTEFFDFDSYGAIMELLEVICKIKRYHIIPFVEDKTVTPPTPNEVIIRQFSTLSKIRRLELNITQEELAKRATMSKRTVERFETLGKASFSNVVKILSSLGLLDELLKIRPVGTLRKRGRNTKTASIME